MAVETILLTTRLDLFFLLTPSLQSHVITYLIAAIWLVNGVFCKIFGMVPRHERIVAVITGLNNAKTITIFIGIAEVCMATWIISGLWTRFNVWMQVMVIMTMNVLEFVMVPDLLLWGRWNIVFAILLCTVIILNYRDKSIISI